MFYVFPPKIDSEEKQVQLITTLDNTEDDLLTLEYIKVCPIHNNGALSDLFVPQTVGIPKRL